MKILFLTRWYPTSDHTYAGVFVREHAKAVRAAGHDVAVVHIPGVPTDGPGPWRMERETDPALTEGIPTYHVYQRPMPVGPIPFVSRGLFYLIYVWSALRAFRRLRGRGFRPDLVHAHVFTAGVPAVVIGKLFGLPVVVTEHFTGFYDGSLGPGGARRARFAFENAARVLPVCASLQRAISAHGIRADFEVVPNAVDTGIFFTSDRTAQPGEPKRLVFVGNLEPTHQKGFPTLVEALIRLRGRRTDWRLDVVGEGPARADYERLVADSDLSSSVVFHGAKGKPEVAEMMRAADAFVLPSRLENLPCVIIEAMTSGLPVVSTTVGGIPEMVSDDDGVLVPPDDPAALADALGRMLSDLGSFDRGGIAARARARYSLETVGVQLSAIYDSVLSR